MDSARIALAAAAMVVLTGVWGPDLVVAQVAHSARSAAQQSAEGAARSRRAHQPLPARTSTVASPTAHTETTIKPNRRMGGKQWHPGTDSESGRVNPLPAQGRAGGAHGTTQRGIAYPANAATAGPATH